jgi:hypothetical protein
MGGICSMPGGNDKCLCRTLTTQRPCSAESNTVELYLHSPMCLVGIALNYINKYGVNFPVYFLKEQSITREIWGSHGGHYENY